MKTKRFGLIRQLGLITAVCLFVTALSAQPPKPAQTPQGGAATMMGGLVVPREIRPSDNSTSTILDKLTPVSVRISTIPEGSSLVLTKDIVFHKSKDLEGNPLELKMDLITYPDTKSRPCVIYITGGGFMFAPKEGELYKRLQIANAGYVVGSVQYHVIQNGIYSDAVKDIKAAVRFLRANAGKYGIDPARIAVWGESAGGYLTAMTGTTNGIKDFEVGENLEQSSDVQACIDVFGLSDLTMIGADYDEAAAKSHFTISSPDGQFIHGKNSGLTSLDKPEVVAKTNPVNYVDRNDPPFLLIHGMADNLVSPSQTLLVHNALQKAGVPSVRYVIAGAGHGGPQFSAPEVMQIMIEFLNKNMKSLKPVTSPLHVKVENGILEGTYSSGITIFRGIPYAAPPVGNLRWKEPQPAPYWQGVRKAVHFGPRAMQEPVFSDMQFRSDGVSEDCLYLNVWTPDPSPNAKLPVLVYFYGGGFVAGDGSEYRYDGESMARQGIVALTVNYRLGVFGFFAHPELSKESSYKGSGNYGLMDQCAALQWVQKNIAAFGGDPARVTIAGESAGSISVSAQMASPRSKDLIAGAIGESGAIINPTLAPVSLAEGEAVGLKFQASAGAKSLADLRAIPAEKLLAAASKYDMWAFTSNVDGYFFPDFPVKLLAAGKQARVPLLLGWNSAEGGYQSILGDAEPTPENYKAAIQKMFPDHADDVLKLYAGNSKDEVMASATALAGDQFISYSTWKWFDLQRKTGASAVYRYYYERPRPAMRPEAGLEPAASGAAHSAEIEYAMGNLPSNRVYDWQPDDYKVSAVMQAYFVNFIKTGNPNGIGLPVWPAYNNGKPGKVMHIDANTRAEEEMNEARYQWLDKIYNPE